MTNAEAIKTLRLAQAEVEWEYPMDISVAIDMAVGALEYEDKYRWHDLRKNPDDLPEYGKVIVIIIYDGALSDYRVTKSEYLGYIGNWGVLAWKYIEPFEEVKE